MGLSLPEVGKALGSYIPGVQANGFLFISGRTPTASGKVAFAGKVGQDLTVEDGYKAAQLCALHCLAVVKQQLGDLDKAIRIIRITGYVNSAAGFAQQPAVINGASDLVTALYGERGQHARSAVGVAELPNNAAVEVEMIVQYESLGGAAR
jgi:enamine deaminase RidA (YjgF/YER057c/UK114 family)